MQMVASMMIGVEDDGNITGIPHKDELVSAMKEAYRQYVHADTPLQKPTVGDVSLDAGRVLYFSIPKSFDRIHLTADGRCLATAG